MAGPIPREVPVTRAFLPLRFTRAILQTSRGSCDRSHPGEPGRSCKYRAMAEAEMKTTEKGLIPQGEGWFVLNARDATWIRSEARGQDTDFEGRQEWTQLGFRIHVLMPGQRSGMYH